MQIIVAKHSGFCFGVQRALNMVEQNLAERDKIYTYGELIHNEVVIEELKKKGVVPIEDICMLNQNDLIIIRSHGTGPGTYERLEKLGIAFKDATCPYVKRIQKTVKKHHDLGHTVIIAGKADHPEVSGINGWCDNAGIVVSDEKDVDSLPYGMTACLTAQTTLQEEVYEKIILRIREHCDGLYVYNTICDTAKARQHETEELSKKCGVMVVIGGFNSSNTRKLADLCRKYCKRVYHIQNPKELPLEIINANDIIGIVAGASTPDWMIREVIARMSEVEKTMAEDPKVESSEDEREATAAVEEPDLKQSVAEELETGTTEANDNHETSFEEAVEKSMVRIKHGQLITGTVVQIADEEVCVNIGYKSDGFIPKNEFSSDPDVKPSEVLSVGDEIVVEVLKVKDEDGNVLLSRKSVEGKKLWDELMHEANLEEKVFEGIGKEVVKGGLIASIKGVRAFVPASQISIKYVENLADYVGQPLKLRIIEVDKSRKRIVASQKAVLMAEAEQEKKEKWSRLVVGSKVTGVVRRLTSFGAFVDIGGIDGLIHVTDIAWGRVKQPSDILKVNQQIEVLILNVDAEKERISLGYKQLQPKPWTKAEENYPVGSVVEGKVVRIVPFGAFVSLEPTIDGLIHISQVAVRRIAKVEDEISVGNIVRCKVLEVNPEAKRISLSRKEVILDENPEIAEEIAREKQERERLNAERAAQRAAKAEQAKQAERERAEASASGKHERVDHERRPRRENADYDLPPVQQSTTSLADLFSSLTNNEE